MILILLQDEVGLRAEHGIQRGKLIRHELRNLAQGLSLDRHHKIKASGDEVNGIDLRIVVDPLCHLKENGKQPGCIFIK